jgi:hypothetical protein
LDDASYRIETDDADDSVGDGEDSMSIKEVPDDMFGGDMLPVC